MDTRITAQMQASQAQVYLQQQASQLATVQNQIATGLKLQKPSDGPTDFVSLLNDKAQNLRYSTYLTTIGNATNDLNSSVSALSSLQSTLNQATQVVQQGINATSDPNQLSTLANQIDTILSSVVSTANTQVGGRYIFGGTATEQPPYVVAATDASGNPTTINYQGSNQRAQTIIGPGQSVDTHYAGNTVFQQPGADLFQTLMTIRDDLRNPSLSQNTLSTDLSQQFATLQQVASNVRNVTGEQSASLQNLASLQSRVQELQLDNQSTTSNLESTDYSSALVKLNEANNIFQATLATSAKIFNQNLLNFIQ